MNTSNVGALGSGIRGARNDTPQHEQPRPQQQPAARKTSSSEAHFVSNPRPAAAHLKMIKYAPSSNQTSASRSSTNSSIITPCRGHNTTTTTTLPYPTNWTEGARRASSASTTSLDPRKVTSIANLAPAEQAISKLPTTPSSTYDNPSSSRFFSLDQLAQLQGKLFESLALYSKLVGHVIQSSVLAEIVKVLWAEEITLNPAEAPKVFRLVQGLRAADFATTFYHYEQYCIKNSLTSVPILGSVAILFTSTLYYKDRFIALKTLETIRSLTYEVFMRIEEPKNIEDEADKRLRHAWHIWSQIQDQSQWSIWDWNAAKELLIGSNSPSRLRNASTSAPASSAQNGQDDGTDGSDIEIVEFVPLSEKAQGKRRVEERVNSNAPAPSPTQPEDGSYSDLSDNELQAERAVFEQGKILQTLINEHRTKRGLSVSTFERIASPERRKRRRRTQSGEVRPEGGKKTKPSDTTSRKSAAKSMPDTRSKSIALPAPALPPPISRPAYAPPPQPVAIVEVHHFYLPIPASHLPQPVVRSYSAPAHNRAYLNYVPTLLVRAHHSGLALQNNLRVGGISLTKPSYRMTTYPLPSEMISKHVMASPRHVLNDTEPFVPVTTSLFIDAWQQRAFITGELMKLRPGSKIDDSILVAAVTNQRVRNQIKADLANLKEIKRPTIPVGRPRQKLMDYFMGQARKAEERGEIAPMITISKPREILRSQAPSTTRSASAQAAQQSVNRAANSALAPTSTSSLTTSPPCTSSLAGNVPATDSSTSTKHVAPTSSSSIATVSTPSAAPSLAAPDVPPPSESLPLPQTSAADPQSSMVPEVPVIPAASPAPMALSTPSRPPLVSSKTAPVMSPTLSSTRTLLPTPGVTSVPPAASPMVTKTLTPSIPPTALPAPTLARSNSTGTARNANGKVVHPLLHFYTSSTPEQRAAVASMIARSPRGTRALSLDGGTPNVGKSSTPPHLSLPAASTADTTGNTGGLSSKGTRSALGLSLQLAIEPIEEGLPAAPLSLQKQVDLKKAELQDKLQRHAITLEELQKQIQGLDEVIMQARIVEKRKLDLARREARKAKSAASSASSSSPAIATIPIEPISTASTPLEEGEVTDPHMTLTPALPDSIAPDPTSLPVDKETVQHKPVPVKIASVAHLIPSPAPTPVSFDVALPLSPAPPTAREVTVNSQNQDDESVDNDDGEEIDQLESDTEVPSIPVVKLTSKRRSTYSTKPRTKTSKVTTARTPTTTPSRRTLSLAPNVGPSTASAGTTSSPFGPLEQSSQQSDEERSPSIELRDPFTLLVPRRYIEANLPFRPFG